MPKISVVCYPLYKKENKTYTCLFLCTKRNKDAQVWFLQEVGRNRVKRTEGIRGE